MTLEPKHNFRRNIQSLEGKWQPRVLRFVLFKGFYSILEPGIRDIAEFKKVYRDGVECESVACLAEILTKLRFT